MTAWQDQPPLSRRQLREKERGLNGASSVSEISEAQVPDVPREGWQQDARRSVAAQDASPDELDRADPGIEPGNGRRSHAAENGSLSGSTASGQTNVGQAPPTRPWVPSYDAPSFRNRSIATDPNQAAQQESAIVDPAHDAAAEELPTDRPLTRRELRARGLGGFGPPTTQISVIAAQPVATGESAVAVGAEVAAEPNVAAESVVSEPEQFPWAMAIPTHASAADSAVTQFEVVQTPPSSTGITESDSSETIVAELEPTGELQAQPDRLDAASNSAPAQTAFERMLFPTGTALETEPVSPSDDTPPTTFDLFDRDARGSTASNVEPVATDESAAYIAPVGHWSRQAEIDDSQQVLDGAFGRDVAATSGALTTSALVLPSVPTAEGLLGPFSATGEILITGSINLPSSMGSTGVQPARYDHSDVDALLEAEDREDSQQDSAPVRAIRAVSTSTSSGDVITSMKPRKTSKLPMVIIIASSVLIVGVVVLLVLGAALGLFR